MSATPFSRLIASSTTVHATMPSQQSTPADPHAQLASTEAYLATDPDNAHLLARAIDLSLDVGEPERALRHAEAATGAHPDDPFLAYRRGLALMGLARWNEARAILAPLAATATDLNLAHSAATCAMMVGEHAAVLAMLAPFRDEPMLPGAVVALLVRASHHSGDLDSALALIAAHRTRLADDGDFAAAAALACLDAGQFDDAAGFSAAARALGHAPIEALVVDATLALANADTAAAVAGFEAVLARRPEEARSWSGLGMASLLKRDLGAAGPQLEHAVKLMPTHIGSWHILGWCRIFEGDLGAAEQAFQTAMVLDRNFAESHGGLAVVAALCGNRDAAEAAAKRALALDRTSLAARYAQMVLAGDTADPVRFQAIALRILRGHRTPTGESLADTVLRHAR